MEAVIRRSGLVLEVPEAEAVVGRHRAALDANARLGVPAHITVLFPFLPVDHIAPPVIAALRRLFAGVAAFDVRLSRTAWFGRDVLWLAPEDARPLRALTDLVYEAFPDYPPFEGRFDDVVPHLTVAHGCDLADMQAAERAVSRRLPVKSRARRVTLMAQDDGGGAWARHATFELATSGTG